VDQCVSLSFQLQRITKGIPHWIYDQGGHLETEGIVNGKVFRLASVHDVDVCLPDTELDVQHSFHLERNISEVVPLNDEEYTKT
jgi:hypothetical protein